MNPNLTSLADRVRSFQEVPTAPFREHWMAHHLRSQLAGLTGLELEEDRYGNVLARLRRREPRGLPATFVAHLDHPGFVVELGPDGRRLQARFEGHVRDEYLVPGVAIRAFRSPTDPGIRGRVLEASPRSAHLRCRTAVLEMEEDATGAVLAMWDLKPFAFNADSRLIHGRALDDLAGAASMVEALHRLAQQDEDVDVVMIFTRAEEAGFCGALCLVEERERWPALLDPRSVFLSVEISSLRPGLIEPGGGAVIRMGDRASSFDGAVVDLLRGLADQQKIPARRALMDGGTCEATIFARAGLRTGGLCVPLVNYHNQGPDNRIAEEAIHLDDLEALTALIASLAKAFCCDQKVQNPAEAIYDFDVHLGRGRTLLKPYTDPIR